VIIYNNTFMCYKVILSTKSGIHKIVEMTGMQVLIPLTLLRQIFLLGAYS